MNSYRYVLVALVGFSLAACAEKVEENGSAGGGEALRHGKAKSVRGAGDEGAAAGE